MVCPLCGCACGLNLHAQRSTPPHPTVVTVLPSKAPGWGASGLCMRGWQMGEILGSRRRLRTPMVWGTGQQERAEWDEALHTAAEALGRLREQDPSSIGIVLGDSLSNEEVFAAHQFAAMLGTSNVAALGLEIDAPAIDGLEQILGAPYRAPDPEELDGADLFLCVNSNFQHINPRAAGAMARRLQGGARMALIDEVDQGLAIWAEVYARHRPGARVEALRQLVARLTGREATSAPLDSSQVTEIVSLIEHSRRVAIILSAEAITSVDEAVAIGRLARALRDEMRWVGVYLLPSGANTFGTLDMLAAGGSPHGMSALDMVSPASGMRAVITIGEDLGRLFGPADLAQLRQRLEFGMALASFVCPTVELADVAVPVQMSAEREGTIRRPDGRVWWSQPILSPAGQSRPITAVLDDLARLLGAETAWDDYDALWKQIQATAGGYGAVRLSDLRAGKLPRVGFDTAGVADVVDAASLRAAAPETPEPTDERPFMLVPRSTRGGWTTDPRCQGAHILRREATLYREHYVLMAPEDMKRLELREGDRAQVTTESGAAAVRVRSDSGIPPMVAVLPTEFPGLVRTLASRGGRRAEGGGVPSGPVTAEIRPVETR